jgi:hypothetical protein
VYRPSVISGDTTSGFSNTSDFENHLIRAIVLAGKAVEESSFAFGWIPVDVCARSIATIAAARSAEFRQQPSASGGSPRSDGGLDSFEGCDSGCAGGSDGESADVGKREMFGNRGYLETGDVVKPEACVTAESNRSGSPTRRSSGGGSSSHCSGGGGGGGGGGGDRFYHLNGVGPRIGAVVAGLRRCGFGIEAVDRLTWKEIVTALPADVALEPYREMLAGVDFPHPSLVNVSHSNEKARAALNRPHPTGGTGHGAAGTSTTDFAAGCSDGAVDKMLTFLADAGFLPRDVEFVD